MTGVRVVGLTLAALAALALAPAARAWAAGAARVTVLLPDGADEAMREVATRTRAELAAAGIAATIVPSLPAPPSDGADVTVATFRDGDANITEVTAVSRAAGGAPTSRKVVRASYDKADPRVLAICAVELVHAALLEAASPPAPAAALAVAPAPPGASPAAAPVPAPASPSPLQPRPSELSVGIGGAWLGTAGGLGAAFGAVVLVELLGRRGLGLSALAGAAEAGGDVGTPRGVVSTDQELLAMEVTYRLRHDAALQPRLSIGLGAYHLGAHGTPGPDVAGVLGKTQHVWAALASGGLGLVLRLDRRVALFADARAFFTNPYPVVVRGDGFARGGNPSFLVSVGLQRTF